MKWDLLPHAESDYIFAIIGEELGFLGCLVVVALYGVLAYAGFRIARRSADRFIQLASVAITVWLIGQAAMNMGYVVGLLPVTGVQLPLISAGGTSLVLTLFIVGLLARFARSEPAAIEDQRSRERGPAGAVLLPVPVGRGRAGPRRRHATGRPRDRRGRTASLPAGTAGPEAPAGDRRPADAGRRAGPRSAAAGRRGARRRCSGRRCRPAAEHRAGRGRHRRAHRADARPGRRAAAPRRATAAASCGSPAWAPPGAWRRGWCPPAATTCG